MNTNAPTPSRHRGGRRSLLAAVCLLSGCAAAIPMLVSFAADLLTTAGRNHAPDYAAQIEELMIAFTTLAHEQGKPAEPSAPAERGAQEEPLVLDATILARRMQADGSRGAPEPIADGTVLHDRGGGQDQGADSVKIQFRTVESCYVYVVAIDATGWAQVLFPSEHTSVVNPVPAGREVLTPQASDMWGWLDNRRGIEHVYFVASREPRPQIEAVFQALAARGAAPPLDPQSAARVGKPAVVTRGFPIEREKQPSRINTEDGQTHQVEPQSYLAALENQDVLLITRWFDHQQ